MKNKIIDGIAVVSGALILMDWFMPEQFIDEAYQLGHNAGAALGEILLLSGLYIFLKKPE